MVGVHFKLCVAQQCELQLHVKQPHYDGSQNVFCNLAGGCYRKSRLILFGLLPLLLFLASIVILVLVII